MSTWEVRRHAEPFSYETHDVLVLSDMHMSYNHSDEDDKMRSAMVIGRTFGLMYAGFEGLPCID